MPVLTGVNDEQDYAVVSSEYMQLQYKDGTTWNTIHGITDYALSGGGAPTRDVTPANGGVGKRRGRPRVPDITFQSYLIPNDRHWRKMRDAYVDGSLLQFRIRTDGERTFLADTTGNDGATFKCDATGVVTFEQTAGSQLAPTLETTGMGIGSIIHTASTNYVIDNIDSAGAITIVDLDDYASPTAVTTGVQFAIYNPAPQEYNFSASVINVADASMNAEGELMVPLSLSLVKPFPKPTVLTDSTILNLTA